MGILYNSHTFITLDFYTGVLKLKENERNSVMKKVFLTLLGIIVVVGVLAGAGFTGYRIGYNQGANGGNVISAHRQAFGLQGMPMHNFDQNFGPQGMPMQNFNRGFDRGFGSGGFRMMGHGFFSPLMSLGHIIFWVLIIGFVYWLVARSGWKLSLSRQTVETPKVEPVTAEKTE